MSCIDVFVNILKALFAGICISIGGLLFITSKWVVSKYLKYNEIGSIVGSDLFSVGLFLVCKFKLLLFTGKIGLAFESKQDCEYWSLIILMLVLNVASAYGFGYLCNYLISLIPNNNSYMLISQTVGNSKLKLNGVNDYLKTAVQSVFCGTCVHMAVKSFNKFKGDYKGIIILNWFVFIFVYSGFQHCIANTFYFGLIKSHTNEVYINIAICIVGNMIGTLPLSLITKTFQPIDNSIYSGSSTLSTEED